MSLTLVDGSRLVLDLLFPRACLLCGTVMAPRRGAAPWPVCPPCLGRLRPWTAERCPACGLPLVSEAGRCMRCRCRETAFDSAYPLMPYEGAMRILISSYKEKGRRSLAGLFASLMAEEIEGRWPDRCIVPVPPRPVKLLARERDHIERIVRALNERGFPVSRLLRRGSSEEQKSLGRGDRSANAMKAYALKPGARPPRLCLLVDDVITTGATLDACARALKAGGAKSVDAIALAAD